VPIQELTTSLCNQLALVHPEDGGDTILRNVGSYNSHTVLSPIRWQSAVNKLDQTGRKIQFVLFIEQTRVSCIVKGFLSIQEYCSCSYIVVEIKGYMVRKGEDTPRNWQLQRNLNFRERSPISSRQLVSRLAGAHWGNLCLISCSHHLKWMCSSDLFFFPLAPQPQFGPWPTSMKLSVSFRCTRS
jgi:hypothetical protein